MKLRQLFDEEKIQLSPRERIWVSLHERGYRQEGDLTSALYCVCQIGCLAVVNRLLEDDQVYAAASGMFNKPLHSAAFNGHLPIVERLLLIPHVREMEENIGCRALEFAAAGQHFTFPIIKQLFLSIPRSSNYFYSVLKVALQKNNVDLSGKLIHFNLSFLHRPKKDCFLNLREFFDCEEYIEKYFVCLRVALLEALMQDGMNPFADNSITTAKKTISEWIKQHNYFQGITKSELMSVLNVVYEPRALEYYNPLLKSTLPTDISLHISSFLNPPIKSLEHWQKGYRFFNYFKPELFLSHVGSGYYHNKKKRYIDDKDCCQEKNTNQNKKNRP